MSTKSVARFITLTALFLVPFFALIVANSYFFPFITGKAFYFRILVEIAFAGWIVLAFCDAKYRPRLNSLTVAVTVFALITLVADLLGMNPIRSISSNFERMEGWLMISHLWMFFMAITYTFGQGEEGKRMWFRWLNLSLVVAFYIACRGALQWAGKIAIEQSASRPDSTLGNAAYLAVYMLINSGIAAYLFLSTQIERKALVAHHHKTVFVVREWVYAVLAIFFGVILFSTATRGAIIGYFGGILLALFLYVIFGGHKDSKHDSSKHVFSTKVWRMISGGVIVAVLLAGFFIWSNRSSSFVQKSETLSRMTSISLSQFKNEGRSFIWPMALKGFTQRPVLGWGQENFNYIFNANYNPKMWNQEQWFDRAHSVYLDWLIASGLVGLIAYLSLYVLFLIMVWKSSVPISVKSALTGLLAGYAVNNVFVFDNLASYVGFFTILSLVLMLRSIGRSDTKTLFGNGAAGDDVIEYVVAPVVIVALALGIYFVNMRPIQANRGLITALQQCQQGGSPDANLFKSVFDINSYIANEEAREQLLSCAGSIITSQQISNPTKQAFTNLADKAIADQIAATPKDARIYTLAGSFLNSINRFDKALPMLETAQSLSPGKQSIDFDLAMAYINTGKPDKAIELLKTAYESATDYTQARLAYAAAMVYGGKEAEARNIFKDDPTVFNSETLARVFDSLKQYDKAIAIYKDLISKDNSIQLRAQLAQTQYTAGLKSDAIDTLRAIEKDYPEYTDNIEQAIKQMK
ncbi:MAG: O-antigen ligase family protein [Candidatus Taylorbacteria bacterium]